MARIKGLSRTKEFRPTVKLVSMTNNPVGTLFTIWHGSRHMDSIDSAIVEEISRDSDKYPAVREYINSCYPEYSDGTNSTRVIKELVNMVIRSNLPPTESVWFTFEINNASVAWREQLVRGRLSQQYWTQTSRTADLRSMDVNRSENIYKYGGEEAVKIYNDTVQDIRNAYVLLENLGVPVEDIRLQPQGHLHRVYWMISLRTLVTIVPKRLSWIAQASLWSPIIEDIVNIIRKECPMFDDIFGTPADIRIKDGVVVSHSYDNENEDRYYGRDPQPVDPLWLMYRGLSMPEHTNIKFYDTMKSSYIKLWSDQVCSMLGWDKNDPSVLGKYDRPVIDK